MRWVRSVVASAVLLKPMGTDGQATAVVVQRGETSPSSPRTSTRRRTELPRDCDLDAGCGRTGLRGPPRRGGPPSDARTDVRRLDVPCTPFRHQSRPAGCSGGVCGGGHRVTPASHVTNADRLSRVDAVCRGVRRHGRHGGHAVAAEFVTDGPIAGREFVTAAVPHRAWYVQHRDAILEEAAAIRSLVAQLSAVTDSYVLAMICTKGVELDEDKFRAAYEAADVHPDWVHAVDLTRWMIASCHRDARRSVAEVLPELDDAVARVEVWLAGMVDAQPGGAPSSDGPGAAGTPVTTAP